MWSVCDLAASYLLWPQALILPLRDYNLKLFKDFRDPPLHCETPQRTYILNLIGRLLPALFLQDLLRASL